MFYICESEIEIISTLAVSLADRVVFDLELGTSISEGFHTDYLCVPGLGQQLEIKIPP